jgi:putative autoinducer-2 (AI-2) aldolase
MAYRALQEGAAGVDMGRNIFQSEAPGAMIQAVARLVHDDVQADEAYELFRELSEKDALA